MHRLYCFLPQNVATVFRTNRDGCMMRRCAQAMFHFAARYWVELDLFLCVSFFRVVASGGDGVSAVRQRIHDSSSF